MRLSAGLVVLGALALGRPAEASSISRDVVLRVFRKASPAVSACAGSHTVPLGRYVVQVTILGGRARAVVLGESPAPVSPRARVCLEASFAALAYPELASLVDGSPEIWRVNYPFVLVAPEAPARLRPRPARIGISPR